MSQSEKGKSPGRPQGGRPSKSRPHDSRDANNEGRGAKNWREHLGANSADASDRPNRGGGRPGGDGRPGQGGQRRGGDRPQESAPALEYVLVQPNGSLAAPISRDPGPLEWSTIPDNSFLKPGLYLRYRGSLQMVARELAIDNAVLFVLWDDEQLAYRRRDGWERPGLRAGFLIPTSYDESEGPPWIPLDAAIPDSIYEWDRGLLSSHLDPSHCTSFRARLTAVPGDLNVSSEAIHENSREKADKALLDTIAWLARHPQSDHPGAVAARTMLIEQGHGLQRAGIVTMRHDEALSLTMLQDVLSVLAPDVAPVLQAVYDLWASSEEEQSERFMALARVLRAANDPRSSLQAPRQLATLATWLVGIFGARADRERRRPARSLFAALRMLRKTDGDVEALRHVDVELPTFPTSRGLTDQLIADLSWLSNEETDLERLVRALAVGESSRDFARPSLAHLRPFAHSFFRVRPYPVATRTLLGRYDGITTMWSFRGRELDERGLEAPMLASSLVLQTSTWASSRAYGRILGLQGPLSQTLADALRLRTDRGPEHAPEVAKIAELHEMSLEDAADRLGKATRARRPNADRVVDAIASHEYIVSRLNADPSAMPEWHPVEPEWTGGEDSAVRRHFMYWRTWCRSVIPREQATYTSFIQRVLPSLHELPWKLENEALALIRNWSAKAEHEALEPVVEVLRSRFEAILDEEGAARDERLLAILSVYAAYSFDTWEAGVRELLDHPSYADAEWNRILELPRQNDAGEALLTSSIFREIHRALAVGETAGVAVGRVEWVRQATIRGRRGQSLRWLLARDAWPEIVFSAEFVRWFGEKGLTLLEDDDAPVAELLSLALVLMTPETVDIAANHLAPRLASGVDGMLSLLLDNQRALSAASVLALASTEDAALATRVIEASLAQAKSVDELRVVARASQAVRSAGLRVDADALRAVGERIVAHEIPRGDRATLVAWLEAWRLANAPLDGELVAGALRSAVFCLADTNDQECRRFLSWAVENAVLNEVGDDLRAALRSPASFELFSGSLADFQWSESLQAIFRSMRDLPRRSPQHAAVMSAIHAGESTALLETLVDGEFVARGQRDTQALVVALGELRSAVESVLAAPVVEEPAETTGDDEAGEAEASEAGASEEGRAPRRAGKPFSELFAERVRRGLLERLRAALSFWTGIATSSQTSDFEALSPALVRALVAHDTQRLSVRDGLLAPSVFALAKRDLKIDDPRNVIANPILRGGAELSPAALGASVDFVAQILEQQETGRKIGVTRDGLTAVVILAPAPGSESASTASETLSEAAPEIVEAVENSEGIVQEIEDATETETDEVSVDDAEGSDASSVSAELPQLVRVWRNVASDDEARASVGSSVAVALLRRVLKRNEELTLSVQPKADRVEIALRWGRPRRQQGRRRG